MSREQPSVTTNEWKALDYLHSVGGASTAALLKHYGHAASDLASLKSKGFIKRSGSSWSITANGRKALNK